MLKTTKYTQCFIILLLIFSFPGSSAGTRGKVTCTTSSAGHPHPSFFPLDSRFRGNDTSAKRNSISTNQKKLIRVSPRTKSGISPSTAFFRSLALPGWGHHYAGKPVRGAVFSTLELGLWTGLLLSHYSGVSLQQTYESYASEHAGIQGSPDHQFYVDIGQYSNRDEFNRIKRQQRDYDLQYWGESTWWQWDSASNRERFKDLRIRSDRHFNNVYFFVGGLLLNRLIAGVDAARSVTAEIKRERKEGGIKIGFDYTRNSPAIIWTGWAWR